MQKYHIKKCTKVRVMTICSCGSKIKNGTCESKCHLNFLNYRWKVCFELFQGECKDDCQYYSMVQFDSIVTSGRILDSIMGMTAEDFVFLARNHDDIIVQAEKFFYRMPLFLDIRYNRVLNISLPEGCQLNFLNWLGLQNGYDTSEIISELLSRYDFEDEIIESQSGLNSIEVY
ncbi:hypothetical protein TRFO_29993 [Tritrichomonas foetus]|uniref:Uncharacterized protein n=1 Tax=Tritrichomonas foetus TaxID=1144522 RepID=A0A1J4JVR2_9EUKA|nr:hypothetical protein TRFO_29993 [Tritrichomonas foetus]|eukprot:OHT02794.1 hypothetical protein TRFO_29993 [Tritrichomonas foetus]